MGISTGDVIRLKGGGPMMTVKAVDEEGSRVTCTWLNMDLTEETGTYPLDDVVPAERPKPTVFGPGGLMLERKRKA